MNARPLSASGRHAHYYSVSGFIDEMPINKNIVKITGKGGSTFVEYFICKYLCNRCKKYKAFI